MMPPRTDTITGLHIGGKRLAELAADGEPTDEEACHLLACAACSSQVSAEPFPSPLDDLPLLRAAPPVFDLREGERRLLAEAARPERFFSPYRVAISTGLVGLAAAALLFVAVRTRPEIPVPGPSPIESHATITPAPSAQLATTSRGPDEVVTLSGEARFEVRKLPPGERFRVRVGTDEVEVRGTRFTVQTDGTTVSRVTVEEGIVDVRAACCPAATVRAGESWTPPATQPGSSSPIAVDPPPQPSVSPSGSTAPSANGPSGAELLAQGTAAYDAGRYAAAAVLLARAVATDPNASWARDTSTLAGAARVLSTPPASVPSLGVSVASFDTAATRARQRGDARLASAAALGAARHLSGKAAESRYCALKADAALSEVQRKEAAGRCPR